MLDSAPANNGQLTHSAKCSDEALTSGGTCGIARDNVLRPAYRTR